MAVLAGRSTRSLDSRRSAAMNWQPLSITIRFAAGALGLLMTLTGVFGLWIFFYDLEVSDRKYWGLIAAIFGGIIVGVIFVVAAVVGKSPGAEVVVKDER